MCINSHYWMSIAIIATLTNIPENVFAYGEGEDIPMEARAVHVLTNEARNDPVEALADCGDNCKKEEKCYSVMPPFYWNDNLYKAAQMHANNLSAINCMQHSSPCKLVSTIASDFPDKCDGSPSCACEDGVAQCGAKGTSVMERLQLFGNGYNYAENLATTMSPGAL